MFKSLKFWLLFFIVCFANFSFANPSTVYQSWNYESHPNHQYGNQTEIAVIVSTNSLNLIFPNQGSNWVAIGIGRNPRQGTSIVLSVDRGEIACQNPNSCKLLVKFDDFNPKYWEVRKASDGSTDNVKIMDSTNFISAASRARRIQITLPMVNNGDQVIEFRSSQKLIWKQ